MDKINIGDFFALRTKEQNYYVFFVASTREERSPFHYCLIAIDKLYTYVPNIKEVQSDNFFGIISSIRSQYAKDTPIELAHIWSVYPDIKPCSLGGYSMLCYRKELKTFKTQLIFLGNKNIVKNLVYNGNSSIYPGSLEGYYKFFENLDDLMEKGGQIKIKLEAIIL